MYINTEINDDNIMLNKIKIIILFENIQLSQLSYIIYSPECQQIKCRFQQNFRKWTSGNQFIDKFIQEAQQNAKCRHEVLEWIPYDRLIDVEYFTKGGFSTIYKATWLDGPIDNWDPYTDQWNTPTKGTKVILKRLNN